MSESCAVPLYLAGLPGEQGTLALQASEEEHPAFLQWLFHADATLTFPQAVVMRYGLFELGRADAAADDYGRWFIARLRLLNAALADGREFLCAGRFTVADICVAYALFNACEHGILGQGLVAAGQRPLSDFYKPCTRAYLDRMIERPAWCAAQRAQGTDPA